MRTKFYLSKISTIVISALLFIMLSAVCATPADIERTHFIILMDDSKDFKTQNHHKNAVRYIPQLLFEGKTDINPPIPEFTPEKDYISLVSFAMYPEESQKNTSALPEKIFNRDCKKEQLIPLPLEKVENQEKFKNTLSNWVDNSLRYRGKLTPIATSQLLVLPYIEKELPSGMMFSKTILITITNLVSTSVSPAFELSYFSVRINQGLYKSAGIEELTGRDTAEKFSETVLGFYDFSSPDAWNLSYKVNPNQKAPMITWFMFSEIKTRLNPDELLDYPTQNILIDRWAMDPEEIQLRPDPEDSAILKIKKSENLDPLSINLRLGSAESKYADNSMWGKWENKLEKTLDLTDCVPPQCEEKSDAFHIRLLEPLSITTDDDYDLTPADIIFDVKFLLNNTGVYDRLFQKTGEKKIHVIPKALETVPQEFFRETLGEKFQVLHDVTLDNKELAARWKSSDMESGLSQSEAKYRIIRKQSYIENIILFTLLCLLVLGLFLYFLIFYPCPFQPDIEWKPAAPVEIDLNNPTNTRLLVGTMEIINNGHPKGRLLGLLLPKPPQPTRNTSFEIVTKELNDLNLKFANPGEPMGFIGLPDESSDTATLNRSTEEIASHKKPVYIFFAAETIKDYEIKPNEDWETKAWDIGFTVDMKWTRKNRWDTKNGCKQKNFDFRLVVKPEEDRKPEVRFYRNKKKLSFKKGEEHSIGAFEFISSANHLFAKPFKETFEIETLRDNSPLPGKPVTLGTNNMVIVHPKDRPQIPLRLRCDGKIIRNPEPIGQPYSLKLHGEFDREKSKEGPYSINLFRDEKRSEIELEIEYLNTKHDVYWKKDDDGNSIIMDRVHITGHDKKVSEQEHTVKNGVIVFNEPEPTHISFEPGESDSPDILTIRVGNSAKSGDGYVRVTINSEMIITGNAGKNIEMKKGWAIKDLPVIQEGSGENPKIRVNEGEDTTTRRIGIRPEIIDNIISGLIPTESGDECKIKLNLDIEIRGDSHLKYHDHRVLTLEIPISIEQEPGQNWLCVDFGTSAIAVALGTGEEDETKMVPLQKTGKSKYGICLEKADEKNMEKGTDFLPSWVICDADDRLEKDKNYKEVPQGFPTYKPASQIPGEAHFLALPAQKAQLRDNSGKVIFSLKNWLGNFSETVSLQDEVIVKDKEGRTRPTKELNLNKVMESAFRALIKGYLLTETLPSDSSEPKYKYKAGQIVLTHPNTFSRLHKDRLKKIAFKAFQPLFNIPLEDRIQLVSESDAVAYYYCLERQKEKSPVGPELILVYDFGGGTLDISIIEVVWKKAAVNYPGKWKVMGRIGLPLAGNYIDELLARIIHNMIKDPDVMDPDNFEYVYPLAADGSPNETHKRAIFRTWEAIKQEKHKWDGKESFKFWIGELYRDRGLVMKKEQADVLEQKDSESVFQVDDDNIYLSIPPEKIHGSSGMSEFIHLITEDILNELFERTDSVSYDDINTLIISGRSALWPGLQDKVASKFPNAKVFDGLLQAEEMKKAVVQGAIAKQGLAIEFKEEDDVHNAEFAILLEGKDKIIPESKWGEPIDLTPCQRFSLIQVMLKNPDPSDLKTIKKHFYIHVKGPFRRDNYCLKKDNLLRVEKEEEKGNLTIVFKNSNGKRHSVTGKGGAPGMSVTPMWPVGKILLDSDD